MGNPSNLWASLFQTGTAANRPTTPEALGPCFYLATDTNVLSIWNGSAWVNFTHGVPYTTYANLPASPVEGQLAVVTDGNSATYANGAAIAGGGSTVILALYNGTAWVAA
jgi:hypothetical protein